MNERILMRRYRAGVLTHRRKNRLNWYVYAVASRLLGDHRAPDPYPETFRAYCHEIQETPKRVARLARAYRYWLQLYLYWLDPPDGVVLHDSQSPRLLRRALSLTHFEAAREAGLRSVMTGAADALEQLRTAALENTPARVFRAELHNEVDAEQGILYHEWVRRLDWMRNNAANLPEGGRARLWSLLEWWEAWEKENSPA